MRSTRPLIPASIAAALIVSGLAGAAVAKDMGMHGDNSGPKMVEMMFKHLDADGDGKISAEEMAAGPERRFASIDANGDGNISAEEMVAHRMAKMQARIESRVAGMIAEMDDNGDGMLSAEEMGPGRRAERKAEKRHARMFEKMDANDDGFVSREEAEAGAAKMAEHHGRGYGRDKDGEGRGGMKHQGRRGHGGEHHGKGMHQMRGGECPTADDE